MIIDLPDLGAISDRLDALHDCPFDLDQAQLDTATHEWSVRFLRPLWDAPAAKQRRRGLLILESRLPVVEARLRVRAVTDVRIVNDQKIRRYGFNRVGRVNGGLLFVFNERMKIEVGFDGEPAGTYEEIPLAGVSAVYRDLFLLQTGPSLQFAPGALTKWAV